MLTVLPSEHLARFLPESPEAFGMNPARFEQADRGSGTAAGTDPYEIRQLRPYQPGDSLRDVHWKLSARTEELLSKQYGGQEEYCARLFLDLRTTKKTDGAPESGCVSGAGRSAVGGTLGSRPFSSGLLV